MDKLQKQTLLGTIWVAVGRFGYMITQFISNLVLARLLTPTDFGTIAILMVFVVFSNVLIDSGFSASLIQKKEINDIDKSTVFFTNLLIALSVYVLLFVTAPLIADYFNMPDLPVYLRVLELMVVIDAVCAIQNTLLHREMNFKRVTKISLSSIIIAAIIAILLAFCGFGIWALIIQHIMYSLIRTSLTWMFSNWHPKCGFSKESFKTLFGYGSKLLISRVIATLYENLQQVIIGHYYTPSDLGYYSQARQFQQIPTGMVSHAIDSASFPVYSKLQDDRKALESLFRKNIKLVSFVNTPLMVLLAIIAHPLIVFLYSSKWIGSIPYFQFLCIAFGIVLAIHQCSLCVIKAMGRSDYILKLEIIKKVIGITFIFIGNAVWGLWGILYGFALNAIIEIFLNGYFVNKEIGYGSNKLLLDILPSVLVATLTGGISYGVSLLINYKPEIIVILIISIVFIIIYVAVSYVFKIYGSNILVTAVKNVIIRI